MLSIMFIFWVLFSLMRSNNTGNTLRTSGIAMIGFITLITISWIFVIAFNKVFLGVASPEHPCHKILQLLSQIKGTLFIIIPIFSFVVYIEFRHVMKTNVSFAAGIIKIIRWQILLIIIMLTVNAIAGFLFMYLLESAIGGMP